MLRPLSLLALAATLFAGVPLTLEAQYFGRNKVQYDQFDFRVLTTEHYNIHYYPEAAEAIEDAARMAERWYERMARIFQHDIRDRRPLVFYAAHPHFQQTNILRGRIGEGTGGVTEGLRDRIVMPLGNSYGATDHVLGHEIVHSFQFDIAQSRRGRGLQGLMSLPLWFVEGMAEYLSIGTEHSLTAMWMRDAVLRDDIPTLRQMSRDPRYFPYRFGHAFWAYVAGEHGDPVVADMLRVAVQADLGAAINRVLGTSPDSLGARWKRATVDHYAPMLEGRTPPGEAGTLLLSPATGAGTMNLAPSLSPDGRYVAFLSEKDLFTVELFVADARTGEVLRSITQSTRDAHFDAIRFLDTSAHWSPDGERLAVSVFAEGRNQIQIYRAEDGARERRIRVPRWIGEIRGPVYSPDGSQIAFSGQARGWTNLFVIDLETEEVTQLTDDRYSVLQPAYSPDGRKIAFVTDRGPGTDFDRLTWGAESIAILDLETGDIDRVPALGDDTQHWNPQFTPDGRGLFFLADPDGFRDIYRLDLEDGQLWRVTRLATGVSGVTPAAPALTVAPEAGSAAFSVFDGGEFHIYGLAQVGDVGDPVESHEVVAAEGRRLPGARPEADDWVERLLRDPEVGLPPRGLYSTEDATDFDRSLGLDWVGQPTIGVGQDQFGTFLAGSVAFSFSDLLGDRNLFVAARAQGEVQDLGGQIFYQDVGRRWNWGVGAAHIPFRLIGTGIEEGEQPGTVNFIQRNIRQFLTQASGQIQYPFSSIRRVELNTAFTRWGFSVEDDVFVLDEAGRLVDFFRRDVEGPEEFPLYLGEASVAFVQDNSFFAFTSPVRGWRSRFEVGQTVGSLGFTTVRADHRRYFAPFHHLTLAVRGLHIGRYGSDVDRGRDQSPLQPMFLGWDGIMRGYSTGSFRRGECTRAGNLACAEFERLEGHRIGVVNLEARIPLLGTDRFGLLNFPALPTELVFFTDAGVAWNAGDGASLELRRQSSADPTDPARLDPDQFRIPVFSSGVSARMNIFGALILEIYYAEPWQRPGRGRHFGVQFVPGW